jgi:hypothetical protein
MKRLQQTFAQRYNRETGRTGHIWGDRYWSQILEGEPPEETGISAGGGLEHRGQTLRVEKREAPLFFAQ